MVLAMLMPPSVRPPSGFEVAQGDMFVIGGQPGFDVVQLEAGRLDIVDLDAGFDIGGVGVVEKFRVGVV